MVRSLSLAGGLALMLGLATTAQAQTPEQPSQVGPANQAAPAKSTPAAPATAPATSAPEAAATGAGTPGIAAPSTAAPAAETLDDTAPATPAAVETKAPLAESMAAEPMSPSTTTPSTGPTTEASCVYELHGSVHPVDAETVATLVCAALQERGTAVGRSPAQSIEVSPSAPAYRTQVRALGHLVILDVTKEAPLGVVQDARSMTLHGLEETPKAADRIAESYANGTPLEATAAVQNLVGEETAPYRKRPGEVHLALGVFGMMLPGTDVYAGYGGYGRVHYETEDLGVGLGLRVGGSGKSDGDAYLVGIDVEGRYFLSSGDITPFVGAGLGILWLGADANRDGGEDGRRVSTQWSGNGLTPSLQVGVEFMRLHSSRLEVLLRADLPLFTLESTYYDTGSPTEEDDNRYVIPISLMAAYSF